MILGKLALFFKFSLPL